MTKNIIVFVLVALFFNVSEAQIIVTNFIPPDNATAELVVCGDNATFTLQVSGNNVTDVVLDMNLLFGGMTGLEYVPSSFSPQVSEDASDLTNPIITIGAIDGAIDLTWDMKVDCDFLDFLNGGGLAIIEFNFDFINNVGDPMSSTWTNSASNGSQEFNSSAKFPSVSITGSTNAGYIASFVGETFNRELIIEQSGFTSYLNELNITIEYESGISVSNQQINGIPINPADLVLISSGASGDIYELTLTDFSTYGIGDGDNLFEAPTTNPADNERFTWSEDVTVDDCENRSTLFTSSWGCNSLVCSEVETQFNVALSSDAPDIAVSPISRTFDECFDGPTVLVYSVKNNGIGFATNLHFRFDITSQNNSAVDASSMTFELDGGAPQTYNVADISTTVNLPTSNCNSGSPNFYDRFDTPILLDLAPGAEMIVTINAYNCCEESCAASPSYAGLNLTARYNLLCGSSILSDNGQHFSIDFNSVGAGVAPSELDLGETGTFNYSLLSFDGQMPGLHPEGEYCFEISVPANLQYDPANTFEWVSGDGSTTLTPTTLAPAGLVNGPATILACFEDAFGNSVQRFRNSNINIDLTYYNCTCGVNVNTPAELYFNYGDNCAEKCELRIICETGLTHLKSGGCCGPCDGLATTSYTIERTCLGEPDNDEDGCPDASGTAFSPNIRLDRMMQGDQARFTALGEVRLNSGTPASLDYLFFEKDFSSTGLLFLPIGNNELIINDANGGTYTCSGLGSVTNGTIVQFDLSIEEIRGCGDVPVDFIFEDGDMIELQGDIVLMENVGCTITTLNYENCFYGSLTPQPVAAGDRLKCNAPIPGGVSAVGYGFRDFNGSRSFTGCGYTNEIITEFCIGGGYEGLDPFPFEFRNWSYVTETKMALPPGYLYDDSRYRMRRTTRAGGINDASVTRDDLVQFANDTFVTDLTTLYADCGTNPNLAFSDEANDQRLRMNFDVPCTIEKNVDHTAYYEYTRIVEFCSPFVEPVFHTGSQSHTFTTVGPELVLQSPQPVQEPNGQLSSWDLFINNLGGGANNSFVVILNPGTIQTQGFTFADGSTVPESNGVFQLGDLSTGSGPNFNLNFTYDLCEVDSLFVVVGYDCLGYPVDKLEVLSGGWPCQLDTLTLYTTPLEGEVQQALITHPTEVASCEEFEYEIQMGNTKRAILYEPQISVFLPYTSGMEIIPGTEEACYPCDPTNPDFNYSLFSPTQIIVTTLGIEYIWDLENLIPEINADGLPGLDEPDVTKRIVRIRFDTETNCDFIGGDFPRFISRGSTACGEEEISAIQAANQIKLDGTTPGNNSLINVSIVAPDDEPINACGDIATMASDITFVNPTDGTDTILIALPLGTTYVPNSALFPVPIYISNTEPITSFVNGIQELRWAVEPNISAFTPIEFVFDFETNPDQMTCRYPEQPILVKTLSPTTVLCKGVPCDVSIASGSKEENAVFEQYQYEVTDVSIISQCGADELVVENITVTNTGNYPITSDTNLDIYFDSDNSNDVDTGVGDILLGTLTNTTTIPVGGSINLSGSFTIDPSQSCPLVMEFVGCSCNEPIEYDEVRSLNAGADSTICNNESLEIGCGENVASFDYFWSGLNGAPATALSDRTIPNPTFTYFNANSTPVVFDYVLTTTKGDCMSFDTVQITILPTLKDIGNTKAICPGGSVVLEGPLGFSNYQWTPITDLDNANTPRPTMTGSITEPITYNLSYTNTDGCEQLFEQKVGLGINCTDLELRKEVNTDMASVGDILTYFIIVENKGPLAASGVEITEIIPAGLSFISDDVSIGMYDETTGLWTIGIQPVGIIDTLEIRALVEEEGLIYNCAEISAMDNTDIDSTPGNENPSEDDKGSTCTTIPTIVVCDYEVPELTAPLALTYQWFIDGVAIGGATEQTFTPDPFSNPDYFGTHTYSMDGFGSCGYIVQIDKCSADLELNKSVSPGTALIGEQVVYTIQVENKGPADASSITVDDILPAGLSYLSHTTLAGSYSGISGVWAINDIPVGGSVTLDITAVVNISGTDIINTAEITGADQPDIDSATGNDDGDQSEDDEDNALLVSIPTANLGNFVWHDANQNGIQDGGEVPIQGVTVELYDVNTGALLGSMITDAAGNYLFTDLPAGDYYLIFDNSTSVSPFNTYVATQRDSWADGGDSDILATGRTENISFDPINGDNLTIDAGFHLECEPGSISISGN